MLRGIGAISLLALACAVPVLAAEEPSEGEDGRFVFKRVQDGFVRLDTRTGQVALCSRQSVGWACRAMADERAALEAEIERLQRDNGALKKELLAHDLNLPTGIRPDKPPAPRSGRNPDLPSDADLDRVMSFLEKAWRRLVDMMTNLQRRS